MKPKHRIIIVSVLAGACIGFPIGRLTTPEVTAPTTATTPALTDLLCPVVRVIDGDTVDVEYMPARVAVQERIRMLYIDTPERGNPLYGEAGEALAAMIGDGPARLEFENPGQPERGGYGRLLAYLSVDGKNLNVELVRQGFSAHYTKYGRGRLAEQFDTAEQEARSAKRGIWNDSK